MAIVVIKMSLLDISLDPLGIYFYSHQAIEDKTLPNLEHKLFCRSQIRPYSIIEPNHLHELVFHSYQTCR